MTEGKPSLVAHRAHTIRLEKRAIKREGLQAGTPVVCSWNLSALAWRHVTEREAIATAVADALTAAASSIAHALTNDPANVAGPIQLPDGVTRAHASQRLGEMGGIVAQAARASSVMEARALLTPLFAVEIDNIRARERNIVTREPLNAALTRSDHAAVATALGAGAQLKRTRSDGQR